MTLKIKQLPLNLFTTLHQSCSNRLQPVHLWHAS